MTRRIRRGSGRSTVQPVEVERCSVHDFSAASDPMFHTWFGGLVHHTTYKVHCTRCHKTKRVLMFSSHSQ